MVAVPAALTAAIDRVSADFDKLSSTHKYAVAAVGGAASVYLISSVVSTLMPGWSLSPRQAKPSTFALSGGSIERDKVSTEFSSYSDSYGKGAGAGITDRSKTVQLVDVFYSLVTDIYEWGWGQSFHFSPKLPGKDLRASEAAHEARVAALLQLKPGMRALDCGCGVGGPMRTISAVSGAHVTGITINQYQVDRAMSHNAKQGLSPLTSVVRGDFTKMPFQDCEFDAAYAIEATCHAAKLEDVYSELFRVLKPGSYFVSYEWVSTAAYDPNNPEHVKIIDEINFGNGLPEMRSWKDAENAGKNVGFELLSSLDLASASIVSGPWYERLRMGKHTHQINHALVSTVDFIGIAPKGLKDVHEMLVNVAKSLIRGGETGVFSPMHLLVFRKPAAKK